MKVTINKDGRTNIECPNCEKIFNPHIPNPKNRKVVCCTFCNHRFIVQAQKRCGKLVWVNSEFVLPEERFRQRLLKMKI